MTFRRKLATGLASMGALFLLLGCSSGDSKGKAGACSAAGADRCQGSQQICVASGGSETCQPCSTGQYAPTADACVPIPGDLIAHDFGAMTLQPGDEIQTCQSWTLNNDTEIWVNGVEMINGGIYHHSNWLWVPDTLYQGQDGVWDCKTRHATPTDAGYDELTAVASGGGVLFAQSTQAKHQVQKFRAGAAVRLPPHVRILAGTHLLNVTPEPVTTDFTLNVYTISRSELQVPLAPFRLSYLDLQIQPDAESDFGGACDVSSASGQTPGDLDMDLYYVMPHYHALGKSFELQRYGGPNDGEVLYTLGQFDSEAHGKAFDPPVSMRGSQGFRFTCGFQNPYSSVVKWGVGDVAKDPTAGEMCVMLGFGRANIAWDGHVITGTQTSASGGVFKYSGDCGIIALPFAYALGDM